MVSYFSNENTTDLGDECLNPCCSGRWSRTTSRITTSQQERVLILVVVEDGLVLELTERAAGEQYEGLNPCCSGRWSRTRVNVETGARTVVMGLNPCCSGRWSRTPYVQPINVCNYGLNPCCSGRWSRTRP